MIHIVKEVIAPKLQWFVSTTSPGFSSPTQPGPTLPTVSETTQEPTSQESTSQEPTTEEETTVDATASEIYTLLDLIDDDPRLDSFCKQVFCFKFCDDL